GLPTAAMLAARGLTVYGVDIEPAVVEAVNRGDAHIEEPGLKSLVQPVVAAGKLRAFTQPQMADVYIIAVPTPITEEKKADLRCVEAAARSILPLLKAGD